MKKYGFLFMVLFLLSVAFTPFAGADESSETRIRLSFPGGEAIVVLDDDPAAHDFLSLLPLTLRFEDYNRTEKISYLPRRLDTGRSPDSCDPSEGSFTYMRRGGIWQFSIGISGTPRGLSLWGGWNRDWRILPAWAMAFPSVWKEWNKQREKQRQRSSSLPLSVFC